MALKVHVMGNPGLPALFCVHGFASNAQIWRPLGEALGDRFALHAVDLPGCGESPASDDELDSVIDELLTRYVEALVYQAVADNMASEQSARMVAMKAATDNAGNLIAELKLIYNKTRQAAITKELSEIVGGAAAV